MTGLGGLILALLGWVAGGFVLLIIAYALSRWMACKLTNEPPGPYGDWPAIPDDLKCSSHGSGDKQ